MRNSLGLIEMRSIATGIKTADEMLKSADVELIMSSPICPGKYVILVSGNVGSVKNAVETGIRTADIFLVESHIINNLDDKVIPALSATTEIKEMKALGVIETISALTSVKAGDIAVKASSVELIEIRIARGLGGKGFVVLTGELSSVKSAVQTCLNELKDGGEIVSTSVIPSPHPGLIPKLF
nr:BMC domain-containing protein [Sedimentibacter sp.]